PGTAPPARERELPVAERVRRFLATASPAAAELAAHVAVSVPSLPVMRLIQHRILGRSGPGQLAEVLLSGLLRPVGGVRYEFVPGAREALLDTLPRPEAQHTRHVLEAVSAEIERRAGTSAETFRALLPAEGGPLTLTAATDHFALLTPETRTHLAPATRPPAALPGLLDIQGATVDELIGGDWDRPFGRIPIGVTDDLDIVTVDVPSDGERWPHGLITGPARHALLRTFLFGLALRHSPSVVSFTFADISRGAPFDGLENLPHVVNDLHADSADSPLIGRLRDVLEAERDRRKAVLRNAGTARWDDYRAAAAEDDSIEPLPAMLVVIDDAGALLTAQPGLLESIAALSADGSAEGIRFVFCTPDGALPLEVGSSVSWHLQTPGAGGPDSAFLRVPGKRSVTSFRPGHIPPGVADGLVERMKERARQTRRSTRLTDETRPTADTSAPPPAVPRFDVLKLNGGGTSGMFEETWARPPLEPRDPAIGYDADDNIVTLYPLDIAAGIPHGLIVGETEARQHTVRNIALALASCYSPGNLSLAFAGLGEHPLGEPLDLPHVVFSDDELLGRPQHLRRALGYLAGELESRAADQPGSAPGLLVFADVSLTFPPGQREMAEALLSLAQRGRMLGVQLLVSASTVEDTTTWNRFLPLLGWRVAASRLPPDVLRRILGQANLQFPDERTAYLRAGNNGPRQFTLAPDPPRPAIDDFVQRSRHHWHVIWGQSEEVHPDTAIAEVLRRLRNSETQTRPPDERRPRHIVYAGTDMARIARLAAGYGRMLAELGVLSHGDVREATVDWLCSVKGEPGTTMADVFRESRGGVLLLHMTREAIAPAEVVAKAIFPEQLQSLVREHGEDPVVIVCADDGQMISLRRFDPFFTDRYRRLLEFPKVKDAGTPPAEASPDLPELVYARELPAVTGRRIPIGIASGTRQPVYVYFDTDPHLLVAGPPRSGRANALQLLIDGIRARQGGAEAEIHVFDAHEILLSLAEEYGLTEAAGADVGYTDSAEDFRETVAGIVRRPPDAEVFLFVIDRDLDDDPLRTLPRNVLTSPGNRIHLVLARLLTVVDQRVDPMVSTLHEIGAPALLLGSRFGEENRLYGAEPPGGPGVVGRGVLVRGGRRHVLQVAHASPFA
ncbi:FtsK/SpoIIIE domain-containing protein, partial [Actinomadura sp. 7K534]|uniref:FtsK/SpoIIIE domain-containing protein n=1 Tax=Actinomadura sp. 7K534 TaxID=2530366 RepID=UPI001047B0B3